MMYYWNDLIHNDFLENLKLDQINIYWYIVFRLRSWTSENSILTDYVHDSFVRYWIRWLLKSINALLTVFESINIKAANWCISWEQNDIIFISFFVNLVSAIKTM